MRVTVQLVPASASAPSAWLSDGGPGPLVTFVPFKPQAAARVGLRLEFGQGDGGSPQGSVPNQRSGSSALMYYSSFVESPTLCLLWVSVGIVGG